MTIIIEKILIWIWDRALMDWTVFSGCKVVNIFSLWEINTQTTSGNESHATFLFSFIFGSSSAVDILLIWISFSLKLSKLILFKTFFHWPFDDSSISWDCNKTLTLSISVNPLKLPNDISMLVINIFAFSNWSCIIISSDIVNGNITMRITDSNQMRGLSGELTASNGVFRINNFLWETWILQSPECKDTSI